MKLKKAIELHQAAGALKGEIGSGTCRVCLKVVEDLYCFVCLPCAEIVETDLEFAWDPRTPSVKWSVIAPEDLKYNHAVRNNVRIGKTLSVNFLALSWLVLGIIALYLVGFPINFFWISLGILFQFKFGFPCPCCSQNKFLYGLSITARLVLWPNFLWEKLRWWATRKIQEQNQG